MSKLIEKLRKLAQVAPQPMGFHTSRPAEASSKILIISRLALNNNVPSLKSNPGVDAVLIQTNQSKTTAKDIQKATKSLGDIPWGVYLEENSSEITALLEANCDFIVFSPTSLIPDLPQDEKIGKIIQVDSSMDDGLLRTINDLPADAVLVTDTLDNNETLTMHRLMIYRHLANFIVKPLIVPVPVNITEAELKALYDADIDGVLVEMDEEGIKELHKIAIKLPPRTAKKREKGGVILPHISGEASPAPPDEEEEDE